ncbi:protein FAM177A1 isoform X2 [Nothobranchius furzeri]|uniref:Transcript variant X2 n=1 Tax=Nothobranchius furzeri TaxID=105023 RepID=A0A9D2Z2F2_NOTFU|nr:protein FAM177A1 isoform X2 [Nothobranchius furzeri]KAF7231436.1 transcript variant X2 [Nothobranchius furzeri]
MSCSQQETSKRIIHFSSGETLELEDGEDEPVEQQSSLNGPTEQTRFTLKNAAVLAGRISLLACDFLGERLAGVLGLNAAKYQYAIDQHIRHHKSQTSGDHHEGRIETVYLSPGKEVRRYGASGDTSGSSDPRESCREGKQGCDNRGYEAEEDSRE